MILNIDQFGWKLTNMDTSKIQVIIEDQVYNLVEAVKPETVAEVPATPEVPAEQPATETPATPEASAEVPNQEAPAA